MQIKTGGELVIDALASQGVQTVFSIMGGQMGTLFDAIGRHPEMEVVTPRSETVCPLLAAGYTASTGRPAVSMATVGAGVVYEVAGLAYAWNNYLPVISIAPQVQSHKMKPHQENLQACEQDELFAPLTKFHSIVYQTERLPQMVHRAFREANTGAPGPVHLDVPVDVLFRHLALTDKKRDRLVPDWKKTRYSGALPPDPRQLSAAMDALLTAQRPLVIVGQAMGRRGRWPKIRKILKLLDIPVCTTPASSGILAGDSLAGESALFTRTAAGKKLLDQADCVVLAGLDDAGAEILSGLEKSKTPKTLIQVETDARDFVQRGFSRVPVYGDPVSVLAAFAEAIQDAGEEATDWDAWRNAARKGLDAAAESLCAKLAQRQGFFFRLADSFAPDDIVICDGEEASLAGACFFRKHKVRDLFLIQGHTMAGVGLPFAMGAQFGNPQRNVYLITDKDSLFHHLREIQPLTQHRLPVTIAVLDQAPDKNNTADTARVLNHLGLHTHPHDQDPAPSLIASFRDTGE